MHPFAQARSTLSGLAVVTLVVAAGRPLLAQIPAPQAAPAPSSAAAPQPPSSATPQAPFVVTSDAAVFLFFVKADREVEFRDVIAEMGKGLAASTDAARKAQAAGWKVFRAEEPPPPVPGTPPGAPSAVMYVFVIDPAVGGADYSPATLLGEALGPEVGPIWLKYRNASAAPAMKATLSILLDFAK